MKKSVLIINTGGTVGMQPTDRGLRPARGFLAAKMAQIEELREPNMPQYEILEYDPVIDSADMTVDHWQRIAEDVMAAHDHCDGIVVLHGTDSMAYTASALPLMLPGLRKPVILTGSQLPLAQARNDARENLKTAMMLAADSAIPEVCLLFGDRLFRGCRATKVSATRLDAFESPNFPPLGLIESTIEIQYEWVRPAPAAGTSLQVVPLQTVELATFRLFPGMSLDVLRHVLQQPLRALLIEAYGTGNGPSANAPFLRAIADAHTAGTVVVVCTQCLHGRVAPECYATGRALLEAGGVSALDMTREAILTKLMHLFKHTSDSSVVRRRLQENLVGELTPVARENSSPVV